MPEHPLHVGQRHRRVAGHPVSRRMTKIMQPPAAAQRGPARVNIALAAW